ncbi:MAG TPA: GntR family transcriptional regulator [Symbiobacteriaceae bacterium]|jgi:GntR family transcriptional regulator|nr:GntR family transcriptional regulator [Symbiobacteriaceae bacterium]
MALEKENRSLQAQIKQILRDEINNGTWRQGAKLPPEPGLMRRFGVSRITVSQALRDLAAEGLVVRRQGKGTFVSSHPQGWTNLGALLQRMPMQRGENLEHSVNRVENVVPPSDIAIDLQLAAGEKTWCFTRIKLVDGKPAQWEQAHIPESFVTVRPDDAGVDDWGRLFFIEILQRLTDQEPRRCRAFLQGAVLTPALAAAMGEVAGKPTIEVTRLWHGELGQPVMLTRSVLRPDGTRYYVDLPELPRKGVDEP